MARRSHRAVTAAVREADKTSASSRRRPARGLVGEPLGDPGIEARIDAPARVRELAGAVLAPDGDPDGLHPPQLFMRARGGGAASAEAARRSSRARSWRQILHGGGPREILARIVPDDPLGVRAIVARRLEAQALLVEADRAHVRGLALIARWAPRYDGQPELDVWLEHLVDQALAEIAGDDVADVGSDATAACASHGGAHDAFETLSRPLRLQASSLRAACLRFNRLPLQERRAFFELVLRHRSLDEVAREAGRSAIEVARQARRALDLFAGAASAPPPSPGPTEKECRP